LDPPLLTSPLFEVTWQLREHRVISLDGYRAERPAIFEDAISHRKIVTEIDNCERGQHKATGRATQELRAERVRIGADRKHLFFFSLLQSLA
jgi:hypothetical protein